MAKSNEVRTWLGGRYTFPEKAAQPEGKHVSLTLWLALPDGLVVGQSIEHEPTDQSFAESLTRALDAAGAAQRPTRVRVADAALARALSGTTLEVAAGATPELDEAFASLAPFLGETSYFADAAITVDALQRFFASARAFERTAPWKLLDEDMLLEVSAPSLACDAGCLSVVGRDDVVRGFALFPSFETFEHVRDASDDTKLSEHYEGLYFAFDRASELPERMVREVKEHGFDVASDAYPVLMRIERGARGAVTAADYALAGATMDALVAAVTERREVFQEFGELDHCQTLALEDGATLTLTVPHPDYEPAEEAERAPTLEGDNPYELPLDEDLLEKLEDKLGEVSLHEVIGMLCAVASVPVQVAPKVWLGNIVARSKFASEAEFTKFAEPLFAIHQHVLEVLEQEGTASLVPEAADDPACRDFARGYATMVRSARGVPLTDEHTQALYTLGVLAGDSRMDEMFARVRGDVSEGEARAELREALADEVQFLYDSWAEARANPLPVAPVTRPETKVGRNDPCPCGSGKKYKKCHG